MTKENFERVISDLLEGVQKYQLPLDLVVIRIIEESSHFPDDEVLIGIQGLSKEAREVLLNIVEEFRETGEYFVASNLGLKDVSQNVERVSFLLDVPC